MDRNGNGPCRQRSAPSPSERGRDEREEEPRQQRQGQAADLREIRRVDRQVNRVRRARPVTAFDCPCFRQQEQHEGVDEERPGDLHRLRVRPQPAEAEAENAEERKDQTAPRDQRFDVDL
jgi:hypothetical protein